MSESRVADGQNVEGFNLSLQLDPDVLQQRLTAAFQHHIDKTAEFIGGYGRFQEQTKAGIADDAQAAKAGEFLKQLRDFAKLVDQERDAAKRPIIAADRTVQSFFRGKIIDLVQQAAESVALTIGNYNRDKIEKARRAREAEAEKERIAAAALAREAEQTRSADTMHRAIARDQNAEAISASAADPALARAASKVVSDQGVTTGTALTPWQVEIVDKSKVPLEYLSLNDRKAIEELRANKALSKLAELTNDQQPISGLRFFRGSRITTR